MVDGAWDRLGEGVHGLVTLVVVDCGDGGGDYGCPFLVGVAVCHFYYWWWWGEVRGVDEPGKLDF